MLQPNYDRETLLEFKYRHRSARITSGIDILILYNGKNHYFTACKFLNTIKCNSHTKTCDYNTRMYLGIRLRVSFTVRSDSRDLQK